MMAKQNVKLTHVPEGQKVQMVFVDGGQGVQRRLADMGLHKGKHFRVLHSHGRGACIIQTGKTRLVIGHGMAQRIIVQEIH